MPKVAARDGTRLYLEEVGAGTPVAFVAEGHAQTMVNLQLKRPTLWEMEPELKRLSVPLLVVVGDEDDLCLDGSVFLKRTAPTAALLVIPRAGHTINSEEPAAVNSALAELFSAAEAGRWLAHKGNA
jgi:pimeloyl-ACP methyl ester carboxylesterase